MTNAWVARRFERQAGKSGRMSLEDFKNVPELSGNAFVTRIFQLSDKDRDGYISVDDFVGAVDSLGRIFSEEEKLKCDIPPPSQALFSLIPLPSIAILTFS